MESNHHLLVRSKVSYPLKEQGINMVSLEGFEPPPPDPKSGTLPGYAIERDY